MGTGMKENTMKRGEVWWYEHPHMKARPALVMNLDDAIPGREELFVVFTSTATSGFPGAVRLGPEDGMATDCVLMADQVDVVEKIHLTKPITVLDQSRMSELSAALTDPAICREP
jgi:mRNA-degrading endonuclease toxin of MazEF toxin-antitoxin module